MKKVKLLRKSENGKWLEYGKGVVKGCLYSRDNTPLFYEYVDSETENENVIDLVPVNSECFKTVLI